MPGDTAGAPSPLAPARSCLAADQPASSGGGAVVVAQAGAAWSASNGARISPAIVIVASLRGRVGGVVTPTMAKVRAHCELELVSAMTDAAAIAALAARY
jgi:hypothetical protein